MKAMQLQDNDSGTTVRETTTEHPTLAAALAAAQSEFDDIPKRRRATVKVNRDGRWIEYGYNYADLADVLAAIRPALSRNGIAVSHRTEVLQTGKVRLIALLMHASGESIESHMDLPAFPAEGKAVQTWGGSLTYARRYQISALCGVASEEDNDANETAAEGEFSTQQRGQDRGREPRREEPRRPREPEPERAPKDDLPDPLSIRGLRAKGFVENLQYHLASASAAGADRLLVLYRDKIEKLPPATQAALTRMVTDKIEGLGQQPADQAIQGVAE